MKKIGLLGGTFDPIHFGHLNLAFELMEKRELDEIWFIPTQINPLKMKIPPTSIHHRLAMTQLAIQQIPNFYLKDLEKERPTPSYTIDTLQLLLSQKNLTGELYKFFFLLGEDSVADFLHWKSPEEIIKIAPLLIGSRTGVWQKNLEDFSLPLRKVIQEGMTETRLMDISATNIRKRLSEKRDCGHLVPTSVLNYINNHQIY